MVRCHLQWEVNLTAVLTFLCLFSVNFSLNLIVACRFYDICVRENINSKVWGYDYTANMDHVSVN